MPSLRLNLRCFSRSAAAAAALALVSTLALLPPRLPRRTPSPFLLSAPVVST